MSQNSIRRRRAQAQEAQAEGRKRRGLYGRRTDGSDESQAPSQFKLPLRDTLSPRSRATLGGTEHPEAISVWLNSTVFASVWRLRVASEYG